MFVRVADILILYWVYNYGQNHVAKLRKVIKFLNKSASIHVHLLISKYKSFPFLLFPLLPGIGRLWTWRGVR